MRLEDIMTRNVKTVRPGENAEEAWNQMRSLGIHHLVVTENGDISGILSDRDLGGSRGARVRRGRDVASFMTPRVVTATPRTTVKQAANILRGRNIGCLLVVRNRKLAGIVTVSDLLELIGRGVERPAARADRRTLRHHRGARNRPGSQVK